MLKKKLIGAFHRVRKSRLTPYIIVALVAFYIGLSLHNFIPAATVNGEAIDRKTFYDRVLRLSGESVMNELVTQKVIYQEAKKRKIKVSEKEVKVRVSQLEKDIANQGLNLKAYLVQQRQTIKDLEKEVETQLYVEKMFGSKIKVTEKDIDAYFKEAKITKGTGAILESQLVAIRQQLYQTKLRTEFLTWLQSHAKKSKVIILIQG